MNHDPKEANIRLFLAQDVAVETLRELSEPPPKAAAAPSDASPADAITHAADARRERRLALQERSIRLRAALALLKLTPYEIEDDEEDDAPSSGASDGKDRTATRPQANRHTLKHRPQSTSSQAPSHSHLAPHASRPKSSLPPPPHPFAGIPAWQNAHETDDPNSS
jgi:hypothetical protein